MDARPGGKRASRRRIWLGGRRSGSGLHPTGRRLPTGRSGVRGRRWWDPIELVLRIVPMSGPGRRRSGEASGSTPLEWLVILAEERGCRPRSEARSGGEADAGLVRVIRLLGEAGREARQWIQQHPAPERQQQVIDRERE